VIDYLRHFVTYNYGKIRYVQVLIVAEVLYESRNKHVDSSEIRREARVGSVLNIKAAIPLLGKAEEQSYPTLIT